MPHRSRLPLSSRLRWAPWLLLVVLLLGWWPTQALAGPWSQGSGHFFVKLSQSFFFARDFVDAQQNVQKDGEYFGTQTRLYAEVGLFYGFQLQGALAYSYGHIDLDADDALYAHHGLSDAEVGLQWSPPPFRNALGFPMALRFTAKIPLYDGALLSRVHGEQATRYPALGDGQFDFTLWLSMGGTIPNFPFYVFGEVGYRFRTEIFVGGPPAFPGVSSPDEVTFLDTFVFHVQVGWNFLKRSYATVRFTGAVPLGANAVTKGHLSLGFALTIPFYKGLAFEAAFHPMLWAQASVRGASISAGLSYAF